MLRITVKHLFYVFFVASLIFLALIMLGIIPPPFNVFSHKPSLGYKYIVGEDLKIGTYLKYAYTYDPEIESVEVLVTNKSLTSVTANITKKFRNGHTAKNTQIWYVGDWKFINDTDIPHEKIMIPAYPPETEEGPDIVITDEVTIAPIYTNHFFRYAFIAGYLNIGDTLYRPNQFDTPIIDGKKIEIWNLRYRDILQYDFSLNVRGWGTSKIELRWDRGSGVLIKAYLFTPDEIVLINLVETNLFEVDWSDPYQYLAFYQFILGWIWIYVISTRPFVGGLIIWGVSFALIAVWDKSQRGGFGAGAKRWMPFLLVLVAIVFIRIIIQFLIYGGIAFFG